LERLKRPDGAGLLNAQIDALRQSRIFVGARRR
jgi:hypothetical protein